MQIVLTIPEDTTLSEMLEQATERLIDREQRPLRAVLVDTFGPNADGTYSAVYEAAELRPWDEPTPADILTRARKAA